jgi:hypothetical protein
MRIFAALLVTLTVAATLSIVPPRAHAQQPAPQQPATQPERGYVWSNAATNSPGWRSQYPLSAMTPGRPAFTQNFRLGLHESSGLTSNGENLRLAEGELVQLDLRSRRFRVRTPDQKELVLYYTDATQFLGITDGVEGLAPASGRGLRILYTQDAAIPSAVAIELLRR